MFVSRFWSNMAMRRTRRGEGNAMPNVYSGAAQLQMTDKVGNGDCVALLRTYGPLKNRPTGSWREGAKVLGNDQLKPGTAIATFVHGRYPNRPTGNHAAFYLRQGPGGFWIIDQFKTAKKIQSRFIKSEGQFKDGKYIRASDNADAFSVIE